MFKTAKYSDTRSTIGLELLLAVNVNGVIAAFAQEFAALSFKLVVHLRRTDCDQLVVDRAI